MNLSYLHSIIHNHLHEFGSKMLNLKTVSVAVLLTTTLAFVGCSKKKEEAPASAASEVPAEVSSAAPVESVAPEAVPASDAGVETEAPMVEEKADNAAIAGLDKPTS